MKPAFSVFLFIIVLAFMFSFFPQTGQCFNLGSALRNGNVSVSYGKPANSTILLWTADDSEIDITLEATTVPFGWSVVIEPSYLRINRTSGSEIMMVPGSRNIITSTSVRVEVTPCFFSAGENNITIVATALDSSGTIDVSQQRVFTVTAHADSFHLVAIACLLIILVAAYILFIRGKTNEDE